MNFEDLKMLKEWQSLFEQGIISEEEYEVKKREILGLPKEENPKIQSSETVTQQVIQENKKSEPATQKRNNPVQTSKSLSANTKFFIVLGAVVLAGAVFWFWNSNSIDEEMNEPNRIVVEQKLKDSFLQVESFSDGHDNNIIKKNDDEDFNSFFSEFKKAVITRDKQKILSYTDEDEFSTGGISTAKEWVDFMIEDHFEDLLSDVNAGIQNGVQTFPDGTKYRVVNPGKGMFFMKINGKWKFCGIIH
ncbi:MAG: SHOCT domain-containing protein [Cloacibacterium sp.]|nr:SHOCT domain-containing protein [Cloacibacterium sp.]